MQLQSFNSVLHVYVLYLYLYMSDMYFCRSSSTEPVWNRWTSRHWPAHSVSSQLTSPHCRCWGLGWSLSSVRMVALPNILVRLHSSVGLDRFHLLELILWWCFHLMHKSKKLWGSAVIVFASQNSDFFCMTKEENC